MAPAAAKLAGAGARARHIGGWQCASRRSRPVPPLRAAGPEGAAAGLGNVAKTGAQAARPPRRVRCFRRRAEGGRSFRAGWNGIDADGGAAVGQAAAGEAADGAASSQKQEQPAWAKRLHRRQQITHAATTAAHTLRGGDGGGSGQGPSLRDSDT